LQNGFLVIFSTLGSNVQFEGRTKRYVLTDKVTDIRAEFFGWSDSTLSTIGMDQTHLPSE
jgi:hypothetical protein